MEKHLDEHERRQLLAANLVRDNAKENAERTYRRALREVNAMLFAAGRALDAELAAADRQWQRDMDFQKETEST
jgi:hypothetical protein